jgi:hypothetical protein
MWISLIPPMVRPHPPLRRSSRATELEVRQSLYVLQTDNDGEFMTKEFIAYCADEDI